MITEPQREALALIAPSLEPGTYLAGGVAVASALGHRRSHDLDLFVPQPFDAAQLADVILSAQAAVVQVSVARGTLELELGGVPISLLYYRHPHLMPTWEKESIAIPIASLHDLACMKIAAIAQRGAAKDFWDLHVMLEQGAPVRTLSEMLTLYQRKYPRVDLGHVIRSFVYFAEADAAPLPLGLSEQRWATIKQAMTRRTKELR